MTSPARESTLRDAQIRAIRYGLAAVVFALLAVAAALVPDWRASAASSPVQPS